MFRNRNNSQKPGEELYSHFKRTFPEVCPDGSPATPTQVLPHRPLPMEGFDARNDSEREPTPNGMNDQFPVSPSLLDPNSMPFSSMASQPPTYYTSGTPAPMGSMVHTGPSQTGMLGTPNLATNLMTPGPIAQRPTHEPPVMPPSAMTMELPPYEQPFDGLAPNDPSLSLFSQPEMLPTSLFHRDPSFSMLPHSVPEQQPSMAAGLDHCPNSSLTAMGNPEPSGTSNNDDMYENSNEDFRYRVSLRASTAMTKPGEIPITYLNKGQAYTMTVADSDPLRSGSQPVKYRTYVRVSFEDDEQRSKPGSCWQLWKEGRGASEAHQRNGKLLAVEHVDPNQGGDGEPRNNNTRVQLDAACLDGFAVTWTPNQLNGNSECAISVRFNFLSTDFSHSKGVKGIPVRLCAKTEVLSTDNFSPPAEDGGPEVSYCKVKLFRDHGAERKLNNDTMHATKTIGKYKQQRSQAEFGSANLDRRSSIPNKAAKAAKHKRTGSLGDSARSSLEQELDRKIETLQVMLKSTRQISLFNLIGDAEDDPDRFPVRFDPSLETAPVPTAAGTVQQNGDTTASPTGSHDSFASSHPSLGLTHTNSGLANSTNGCDGLKRESFDYSVASQNQQDSQPILRQGRSLNHVVKVQRAPDAMTSVNHTPGASIDAMDVDPDYQPPADVPEKPVCCFFVRAQPAGGPTPNSHYHAIYLYERTTEAFIDAVADTCRFDRGKIERAVLVRPNGLTVFVNDEVIKHLPEGQDMKVEFLDLSDMDRTSQSPSTPAGIEMRLYT